MNISKYILFFISAMLLSNIAHAQNTRWNIDLTPEQKHKAYDIIREAQPQIQALNQALHENMNNLKSFSYKSPEDHEQLALLGEQLRAQRQELHKKIQELNRKLQREAGVSLKNYVRGHCQDLIGDSSNNAIPLKKHVKDIPHHTQ